MTRLTASGIDRAERCAWGFRPDAGSTNSTRSEAADAGTEDHGHIENSLDDEAAARADLDAEDAERERFAESLRGSAPLAPKSPTHARWLADWLPENRHVEWHAETAIAIDPRTGETRVSPDGWPTRRDYGFAPGRFIPATIDAYGFDAGVLRVVDWKTGQAANLADPAVSGQLRIGALALSRHLGWRGPISIEFVKVNEDRVWTEAARVGRSDLLSFQGGLIALVERIDASPEAVPGHWCKSMYCGYRGRCPATLPLAATLLPALVERQPFKVALRPEDFVSNEHAAWQFQALAAADAIVEEARAAMKVRARQSPIPLGDSRFYGEREVQNEPLRPDVPGVEAALARVLGEKAAGLVETKRVATKTKIEAAAGFVAAERSAASGEKVPKTAVLAEVWAQLRAIGAMKAAPYMRLAEYEVKPPKAKRGAAKAAALPAPALAAPEWVDVPDDNPSNGWGDHREAFLADEGDR